MIIQNNGISLFVSLLYYLYAHNINVSLAKCIEDILLGTIAHIPVMLSSRIQVLDFERWIINRWVQASQPFALSPISREISTRPGRIYIHL